MKTGQVIFGITTALVVGGVIYFGFVRKYADGMTWYDRVTKGGGDITGKENFELVADRLGVAKSQTDRVKVLFNDGKNIAEFYNNDRLVIGKSIGGTYIVKGSYANGGMKIKLDTGKEIVSGSVWGNLLETLK